MPHEFILDVSMTSALNVLSALGLVCGLVWSGLVWCVCFSIKLEVNGKWRFCKRKGYAPSINEPPLAGVRLTWCLGTTKSWL